MSNAGWASLKLTFGGVTMQALIFGYNNMDCRRILKNSTRQFFIGQKKKTMLNTASNKSHLPEQRLFRETQCNM